MSDSEPTRSESPAQSAQAIRLPSADIAGSAARSGVYVWLASRLFEITGGWARKENDPASKSLFAGAASRFAWQASEWQRRLPVLREVEPAELVRSPGSQATRRMSDLEELEGTAARRHALSAVVSELQVVLATHAGAVELVRDGPVARSISRVRADLAELSTELGEVDGPAADSGVAADLLR